MTPKEGASRSYYGDGDVEHRANILSRRRVSAVLCQTIVAEVRDKKMVH